MVAPTASQATGDVLADTVLVVIATSGAILSFRAYDPNAQWAKMAHDA
ncbi:hypothetical protein ABI_43710 [Asticcacaulis biprosthecium C19]|uniref:Uncharacterized protein n=1 Tax=Asticcacaulis biprosthecium C19 TaxID=715226 RepID=F4QT76_9CAUL|nr:hypothetical protein ABI_43710 [Asticcacaulis biprosthecium C19]